MKRENRGRGEKGRRGCGFQVIGVDVFVKFNDLRFLPERICVKCNSFCQDSQFLQRIDCKAVISFLRVFKIKKKAGFSKKPLPLQSF